MVSEVTDHPSRIGQASLILLCIAAWSICHAYRGIFHDSILYTLQGLAHDSASLRQDVFLRFGSQDRFTIFGSLYGLAIHVLGAETSAALMTFVSQVGVIAAAWSLARAVAPASQALLATAIFISVPGDYGSDQIFACIESFITPRMAAEALVLGALAAALNTHKKSAFGLIAGAILFHPIMAAAGVGALVWLYLGNRHPQRTILWALFATAILTCVTLFTPTGQWGRFDGRWLALVVNRSPYLFLSHWSIDDWGRLGVTLGTLVIGLVALSVSRARLLCQISFAVVIAGLGLTLVCCDLAKIVVVTQLQPWRCQWLGSVIAALLLPVIFKSQWQSGTASRASALLLASAWIFGTGWSALAAASLAIACQIAAQTIRMSHARLFLFGSLGMVAIATLWRLASNLEFTDSHSLDARLSIGLRQLTSFCHDGFAPATIIIACWFLLRWRPNLGLLATGIFGIAAAALVLPSTSQLWFDRYYSRSFIASFAEWRGFIPASSEVYWPQSPLDSWILLDRPNFVSALQASGLVFSRATALEIERRAQSIREFVPPDSILGWASSGVLQARSPQQLQGICDLGLFDFLVTSVTLDDRPIALESGKSAGTPKSLKLYRCRAQARAAAAAT